MQSGTETYGTMYGMKGMRKTTVYLPELSLLGLKRVAMALGKSEAELIRQGVDMVVAQSTAPKPRLPLFNSGGGDVASEIDEWMKGFGERR